MSIRPANPADIPAWAATRGTGVTHPYTQDVIDAVIGDIPRGMIS